MSNSQIDTAIKVLVTIATILVMIWVAAIVADGLKSLYHVFL